MRDSTLEEAQKILLFCSSLADEQDVTVQEDGEGRKRVFVEGREIRLEADE